MSGRMIGAVCLVFVGLWRPAVGTAGPVTFWNEGFESGLPAEATASGNWSVVTSAQAAHSGSRGLDITGPTAVGGDVLTLDLSSAGFTGIEVSFWTKVRESLESADLLRANWSPDAGVTWLELDTMTNVLASDWVSNSFALPSEASDNPNLAFQFSGELGSGADRVAFDDMSLSGTPVPEPATFAMFALGSLAGIHRRLRRRFP